MQNQRKTWEYIHQDLAVAIPGIKDDFFRSIINPKTLQGWQSGAINRAAR